MNVLLTNDDGVSAPVLRALREAMTMRDSGRLISRPFWLSRWIFRSATAATRAQRNLPPSMYSTRLPGTIIGGTRCEVLGSW